MAVIASWEVPIAFVIFYWLGYGSNQVMGSSHTLGRGVMQGVTHGGSSYGGMTHQVFYKSYYLKIA